MDIRKMVEESIQDETNDVEKYTKMSEALKEKYPCEGYWAILRDIAREEGVHKKHLDMILSKLPSPEPDEPDDTTEEDTTQYTT